MGIHSFLTRDLRMSAVGSRSNDPAVDIYLGLLKRVGGETISVLSPYGGTKECYRHCTLTKSALPMMFKRIPFPSISEFLDLPHCQATALDLLSLVRFSQRRAPLMGIFLDAISHFVRYAAASVLKEGNCYMRVTILLTASETMGWHALDEPPSPTHRASKASLARVARMPLAEGRGTCMICYDEYEGGVRTSCGHGFHRGCMALWLDTSPSCPLCRTTFDTSSISN